MGWLRFLGCALAVAGCVLGAGALAPHVMLDARLAFAIAYLAVSSEILLMGWAAPPVRAAPITLAAALAAVVVASAIGFARPTASPGNAALFSLALAAGATLVGALLAARIEKPAHLTAVGLVSAIADLWSVFDPGAPSAKVAQQALAEPEKLSPFALPFPLFGTASILPVIGAGDVVFVALYVAAFRAHGLALDRLLVALALAFVVGLVVLMTTMQPIPLLPLLAVATIGSEPAVRALDRKEWRTVLAVCALLVLAIGLRMAR